MLINTSSKPTKIYKFIIDCSIVDDLFGVIYLKGTKERRLLNDIHFNGVDKIKNINKQLTNIWW